MDWPASARGGVADGCPSANAVGGVNLPRRKSVVTSVRGETGRLTGEVNRSPRSVTPGRPPGGATGGAVSSGPVSPFGCGDELSTRRGGVALGAVASGDGVPVSGKSSPVCRSIGGAASSGMSGNAAAAASVTVGIERGARRAGVAAGSAGVSNASRTGAKPASPPLDLAGTSPSDGTGEMAAMVSTMSRSARIVPKRAGGRRRALQRAHLGQQRGDVGTGLQLLDRL